LRERAYAEKRDEAFAQSGGTRDHGDRPAGPDGGERPERSEDEDLVAKRIEQRAARTRAAGTAGEPSIERIRCGGEDEDSERDRALARGDPQHDRDHRDRAEE